MDELERTKLLHRALAEIEKISSSTFSRDPRIATVKAIATEALDTWAQGIPIPEVDDDE